MEDDVTTAQTPSSLAHDDDDASSPITAATTPRSKFPSDLKTLACTWPGCPKTFNRPARLRDHLNSHTNSRPFKCPYDGCDKDYTVDKHLKQHIKAVHTHERKHVCPRPGCGKSFVTGTRLKRHQLVHEGADRFRCPDCGQSFRKRETLAKHVRRDHAGLPAHACPEPGCDAAFDTKPSLQRHREREHGEPRFWCGECGVVETFPDGTERRVGFTTEALLQAHLRHEHQNCLFCDFRTTTQWELDRHVEMHHSGKTLEDRRTEACPYPDCDKRFTNKSNRNNHVRTAHEGLRFVCGEVDITAPGLEAWSNEQGCGSKFCAKARLEDHIRYIHLGQERPKPLVSTTPETYTTSILDDITGVAYQEKATIQCLSCDATFIRYADLNTHMGKVHADVESMATPDSRPAFADERHVGEPMFGDDFGSAWPEHMEEEEIFAADMNYGPVADEWDEDEQNIMLLARDTPELDSAIDPALMKM
jgi:uncharacterized C2H2 Zn-finger protein